MKLRPSVLLLCGALAPVLLLCGLGRASERDAETLVIYAYQEADDIRHTNLIYFLQHGISEGFDCLLVCNGPCTLPREIPPQVRVLRRANYGMDFGAWQAGLLSRDLRKYRYFIFLNSSVRGPFSPRVRHSEVLYLALFQQYFPAALWWRPLTELLTNEVKLAGATISCMETPHVQSYLFTTDAVGLKLLLDHGIFRSTDESHSQVILNHEVQMSTVILAAGFNIASLLHKYDGVDFRKSAFRGCNQQASPLTPSGYEGITVHPFEVFFVKAKKSDPTWLTIVDKYANWSIQPRSRESITAGPITEFMKLRAALANNMLEACGGVFDEDFYRESHPDLKSANVDLNRHWQSAGRFEGRMARYYSRHSSVSNLCTYVLQNPGFSVWIPQPYEHY